MSCFAHVCTRLLETCGDGSTSRVEFTANSKASTCCGMQDQKVKGVDKAIMQRRCGVLLSGPAGQEARDEGRM